MVKRDCAPFLLCSNEGSDRQSMREYPEYKDPSELLGVLCVIVGFFLMTYVVLQ